MEARVVELLKADPSIMGGCVWWSNSVRGGFSKGYLQKVDPSAELTVVIPPKSQYVDKVAVQKLNALDGNTIITKSCKNPEAALNL